MRTSQAGNAYVPKPERLVGSKSLKLFLGSFRNHGALHEDCSLTIAKRLEAVLEPLWLRLGGYWYPRGGMPIDVFYQSGEPPKASGYPTRARLPIVGAGKTARRCRAECTVRCRLRNAMGSTMAATKRSGADIMAWHRWSGRQVERSAPHRSEMNVGRRTSPGGRLINVLVPNRTTEGQAREIAQFVADRLAAHGHAATRVDSAAAG